MPTPLKNMSASIGMMKFPTYVKIERNLFQTTNQIFFYSVDLGGKMGYINP